MGRVNWYNSTMLQSEAELIMKMGYNVFLTGSAGSGKTYTINSFINWAREHLISVAVTASTGIAATHINGQTIHSWSGVGIKTDLKNSDIANIKKRKDIVRRIQKTKILIIDEISMIDAGLIDNVNLICKKIRDDERPFGGLQVILTGDLFQLPPINKNGKVQLAVESEAWRELRPVICYLASQYRQSDDDPLSLILNSIRSARVNQDHLEMLKTKLISSESDQEFKDSTRLHSHNQDVDDYNHQHLSLIESELKTFQAIRTGPEALSESLQKSCLAPAELKLKVGAEVMFVKNNQQGKYVNGSRGKIVNFNTSGWPVVKTIDQKVIVAEPESWQIEDDMGQPLASITQVPLRLAWAITVHKSQGMSLDTAVIDLSRVFEYGMGYVALSRVRSFSGLSLSGLSLDALNVNPKVIKYDAKLKQASQQAVERLSKLLKKSIETRINTRIIELGGLLDPKEAQKVITKIKANGGRSIKTPSYLITKNLLMEGLSLESVAQKREVKTGTIVNHLIQIINEDAKAKLKLKKFSPNKDDIKAVTKAKKDAKSEKLTDIKHHLQKSKKTLDFDTIRLCLAWRK
jgi:ATP-dependent exoDNAse (exonuclease V) alpha subunit